MAAILLVSLLWLVPPAYAVKLLAQEPRARPPWGRASLPKSAR